MTGQVPLGVRVYDYTPSGTSVPVLTRDRHITRQVRDLEYTGQIPGGFGPATFTLDHPLDRRDEHLSPYTGVRIFDTRSGAVCWEGLIDDVGKGVDASGRIWRVSCVGSSAHASDEARGHVFIDRDLTAWEEVFVTIPGWTVNSEVRDTDDAESLVFRWPRGTGLPAISPVASIQYRRIMDAGQNIALIGGRFDCGRTEGVDRRYQAIARKGTGSYTTVADYGWSTTEAPYDVNLGTDWTGAKDNLRLRTIWKGAAATVGGDAEWVRVLNIYIRAALYDVNGSESQGPYGNPFVRARDIVADLLGRILNRYDGPNALIDQNDDFQIDQLAYPDGATCADILDDLMLINPTYYWAAWEMNWDTGKYAFEWVPWDAKVGFEADVSDGFDSSSGQSDLYNKVAIRWQGPGGRDLFYYGKQTIDYLDTAGVTRSPPTIDLSSSLGSFNTAAQVSATFLAEHASAPNSGTLTIARPITNLNYGRSMQPWELPRWAPGALIRVRGITPNADSLNRIQRDGVTVFKIVGATYRQQDNTCVLNLDAHPRTVQQLLAKLEHRQRRLRRPR